MQSTQDVPDAPAYLPMLQGLQLVEPVKENWPTAQSPEQAEVGSPTMDPYFPAAHNEQEIDPERAY